MKSFLKRFFFYLLRFLARHRLKQMPKVKIIGVTGSMGKTTAKEAIAHILSGSYKVLKNEKSYNTEWGLPMTLLGVESPGRSIVGWLHLFWKAFRVSFFDPAKYDFLVLEMGVDKPGDMDTLLSVVHPDIGVFLDIAPVHLAEGQFKNMEDIYHEKVKILRYIPSDGAVFINIDDKTIVENKPKIHGKPVWFGTDEHAKLLAQNIQMTSEGISFEVIYGKTKGAFSVPILGKHHIYSLLPAIGCALLNGIYMHDIVESMKHFSLPPGRLNLIAGIRDSLIIDSSYNASPEAVKMALSVLKELGGKQYRKIFVFGNMNELGDISEDAHRLLAKFIEEAVDIFVTIGDQAGFTAQEVLKRQVFAPNEVHAFADTMTAREFVKGILQQGDIVLVKGSQNRIRLEKLVKYIMAEPERARDLLVRQDGLWEEN